MTLANFPSKHFCRPRIAVAWMRYSRMNCIRGNTKKMEGDGENSGNSKNEKTHQQPLLTHPIKCVSHTSYQRGDVNRAIAVDLSIQVDRRTSTAFRNFIVAISNGVWSIAADIYQLKMTAPTSLLTADKIKLFYSFSRILNSHSRHRDISSKQLHNIRSQLSSNNTFAGTTIDSAWVSGGHWPSS